jgi:uncharacterized membrane protein YphA (DoxX/SURF4 family)
MITSLLIGKILFGGYFIYSGLNHFLNLEMLSGYAKSKNVPLPKVGVLFSGTMIFLGGLGVLFGIYVNLSLALIAIFLLVVSLMIHNFWSVTDPTAKMGDVINFSKNMALLGAALMLMSL